NTSNIVKICYQNDSILLNISQHIIKDYRSFPCRYTPPVFWAVIAVFGVFTHYLGFQGVLDKTKGGFSKTGKSPETPLFYASALSPPLVRGGVSVADGGVVFSLPQSFSDKNDSSLVRGSLLSNCLKYLLKSPSNALPCPVSSWNVWY
ncbi:MAG: hypothetical protein Q4B40_00005, partial [Clostridia bacterium]|nr:hypothetical protein [Clostridia bacterium]